MHWRESSGLRHSTTQSYITADGQSASLSWCLAPIWNSWPDYFLCIDNWGFLGVWRPLWREDGSVIYSHNCFWALPDQSILGRSPAELTAIFYCLIWDSPNLEGQVPVFISPRNRVAQLYPRTLLPLFVASYDLQGYGAGILTRIHTSSNSSYIRAPSGAGDQMYNLPLWREGGSVLCSAMTQVQFQVTLQPTVCRPVRLGAGPTKFEFLCMTITFCLLSPPWTGWSSPKSKLR
jgi:hypothetical protein